MKSITKHSVAVADESKGEPGARSLSLHLVSCTVAVGGMALVDGIVQMNRIMKCLAFKDDLGFARFRIRPIWDLPVLEFTRFRIRPF